MSHAEELIGMSLVPGASQSQKPWRPRGGWLAVGGGLLVGLLLGLLMGAFLFGSQASETEAFTIGNRPQKRDPLENERHAAALYRINAEPMSILGDEPPYQRDFDAYRRTQVSYVKSPLVLMSALSSPEVAQCGLLAEQQDKVAWLQQNIVAYFPSDGEIFAIALPHPTAEKTDLLAIVNAVAKAYYDEVVFHERSQNTRPLQVLRSSLRQLESRIATLQDAMDPPATASEAPASESAELLNAPRRRELTALLRVEQDLLERISREDIRVQGPPRIQAIGARGNGSAIAEFHDPDEKSVWNLRHDY